jgi:hypothetical protein
MIYTEDGIFTSCHFCISFFILSFSTCLFYYDMKVLEKRKEILVLKKKTLISYKKSKIELC